MSVRKRGSSYEASVMFWGERYRRSFKTESDALWWEAESLDRRTQGLPPVIVKPRKRRYHTEPRTREEVAQALRYMATQLLMKADTIDSWRGV